jgi:hypothetical protein
MSINNYTELQTAIGNWLNRSNLTDRIPEFISLAEGELNVKLRLREMNKIATGPYSNGSRYVALPSGHLELLNLQIKVATADDSTYENPVFVAPEKLARRYVSSTGTPKFYTLRDQIEFNQEVSALHTLKMNYIKGWDISTDTTNWLLSNFEGIYLWGSLLQAEAFVKNDKRVALWRSNFELVMSRLNILDERSKDDAVLSTGDVVQLHSRNSGFNIING